MLEVARYHADAEGRVAPEAVDAWARDGLLVIARVTPIPCTLSRHPQCTPRTTGYGAGQMCL